MDTEVLFGILTAVFAVFGLCSLIRLTCDSYLMPREAVSAIIYDGKFPPEEVGCLVNRLGRRFAGSGRLAVLVTDGELDEAVERVLIENNIEVYYATRR